MVAPATTVCVLVTSLLLISCGDASSPVSPPPAPSPPTAPVVALLVDPSGQGQQGVAGYPLSLPIRVELRRNGAPVGNVAVTWESTSGTVTPQVAMTDIWGTASAEWTLGLASGPVTATARITEPAAKTVTFTATALEEVTAVAVAATQLQSAEVGFALPQPIQVRVTKNGTTRAGVPVRWMTGGGTITESSVTNTEGIASATWTLHTRAGAVTASATVPGDRGGPLTFRGTALAGPPVRMGTPQSNTQLLPSFIRAFEPLVVVVYDRHDNPVPRVGVEWAVEQGAVALLDYEERTDISGRSIATVAGGLPVGLNAIVRAYLGDLLVARFQLATAPSQDVIFFDPFEGFFASGRNRSSPAVDTVMAGSTITWQQLYWDWNGALGEVSSVGTPALPGGGGVFAVPGLLRLRFTEPGTYRYTDPYTGATGTVVVW